MDRQRPRAALAEDGAARRRPGQLHILGRYVVIDMNIRGWTRTPKFPPRVFLECRDVNNGLLIGRSPARPICPTNAGPAVGKGNALRPEMKEDGPLTAFDLATGKQVRTDPGSEISRSLICRWGGKTKDLSQEGIHGDNHWVQSPARPCWPTGRAAPVLTLRRTPFGPSPRKPSALELPAVDEQRERGRTGVDDRKQAR